MRSYICDKRANADGYHQIHTSLCPDLPPLKAQKNIGEFYDCKLAIQFLNDLNLRRGFKFTGCPLCCRPCSRMKSP